MAFSENPQYSSKLPPAQKDQVIKVAQEALSWLTSNQNANPEEIKIQQQILD